MSSNIQDADISGRVYKMTYSFRNVVFSIPPVWGSKKKGGVSFFFLRILLVLGPNILDEQTARSVVATGAWVKIETRHVSDTWRCGSLSFIFTHPPEDLKKKEEKNGYVSDLSI